MHEPRAFMVSANGAGMGHSAPTKPTIPIVGDIAMRIEDHSSIVACGLLIAERRTTSKGFKAVSRLFPRRSASRGRALPEGGGALATSPQVSDAKSFDTARLVSYLLRYQLRRVRPPVAGGP